MSQQPIFGITNIPQDIKLELNNGTLTLKAGSVITFSDGSQYVTTTDKTYYSSAGASENIKRLVYYNYTTNSLIPYGGHQSGTTPPAAGTGNVVFYNTSDNTIRLYVNGVIQNDVLSFPIAEIKSGNSLIANTLEKVFNGFGYIGSTLFVLPNVEGFYPNGKDGFKNIFKTVKSNSVGVYNFTTAYTNVISALRTNGNAFIWSNGFEVVDKLPNIQDMVTYKRYYSKFDNKVFYTSDSVNINFVTDIPFGYCTTGSSSPYNISSLNIVNPFLTVSFHDVSEYAKYLANLLIIQYNSKPKAKATIESLGYMFPDELILSVRDGFNIDTATGKQLDILAKYIGASRGYTDSNSQKAVLTDDEFRILLKLKIVVNNGTGTLYVLETNLYNLFGTGIRVVEGKDSGGNPNMTLTYYIRSDWANIGLAAVQQNILPHPTGVGYTYNLAALTKYFGFIEYTDLSHPFTTGFRDYNDPTKAGEMYAYDKVIQQ